LVGAISGDVSAEAKLDLVRAVAKAKREGMAVQKACAVLSLPRVTYYHWLGGHQLEEVTLAELTDRRAEPKPSPQRVTEAEREAIVAAAKDEVKVDLHHRKLAHTLGREEGVYVSESTVYRVLKEEGLVAPRQVRRRPQPQKPELVAGGSRQVWCWDFSYLKIGLVFWYLLAIIDQFSRKIVGWGLVSQATAQESQRVWDDALVAEGLLDAEPLSVGPNGEPADLGLKALSDNGTQMKAKTMREFFRDLGIEQVFARPHTPEDNAYIESWFATAKCERLNAELESCNDPLRARAVIEEFVRYYNEERLHQGIGFVTPVERHEGRDGALLEARKQGLAEARRSRPVVNGLPDAVNEYLNEHNNEESKHRNIEGSADRLVRISV